MFKSRYFPGMLAALVACSSASAAPPMPNEFESPEDALDPLFAYFGGVQSWGTTPSDALIYDAGSLEVWAVLVDDIFSVAGFAVGTFGTTPPALDVPVGADTFSITIESPQAGQLSVAVILREDDNGDNFIDTGSDDDQWESPTLLLDPGVNTYNIPVDQFTDSNEGAGNNVQNFDTTARLAFMLVFESRDSYEGGQIVGPVSFKIDHVGLYEGIQAPPANNPADLNGDASVDVADLLILLAEWGPCPTAPEVCVADIDENGAVDVADLLQLLASWG